jgi:hypothetical protein
VLRYDISSIVLNVEVGQNVTKGEELGHFQYGGSEIITLFEHGVFTADPDLRIKYETQRKVGQRQGLLSPRPERRAPTRDAEPPRRRGAEAREGTPRVVRA